MLTMKHKFYFTFCLTLAIGLYARYGVELNPLHKGYNSDYRSNKISRGTPHSLDASTVGSLPAAGNGLAFV